MTGDYNVAVAEFGAVDEEGSITSHPEASGFSDSLYRALSQELEQLAETDIQVYSPAETGQIAGTTREERAQVAQQLAEEINADLVVYGNLELGENRSGFIPEFYIRTQKLGDAQELAGQYEFGSSIEGKGNIERNTAAREDLRRQLASRTSAMAQFVTGIGLYMLHDYEDALDHFQLAQDEEGWDDNDGKEVLYLFMGNTATQLKDFLAASEY
jgi:hypothetical protein